MAFAAGTCECVLTVSGARIFHARRPQTAVCPSVCVSVCVLQRGFAVESIIAPSKLTQQRVVQLNQGTADLVARAQVRFSMADWVPTNHKADEKEAARNRKKLMKIIKLPQNAICADCPIKRAAPHHPSIPDAALTPCPLVPPPPYYPSASSRSTHLRLHPKPPLSLRPSARAHACSACTPAWLLRSGSECMGEHQPRTVHLLPVLGDPPQPRHAHHQGALPQPRLLE